MKGGKRLTEEERQKMIFDLSNADACLYATGFTELSSKIATHLFVLKRDDEPEYCTWTHDARLSCWYSSCHERMWNKDKFCPRCGKPVKGE